MTRSIPSRPSIVPFGDRGIVVEFADELSPETNGRARALARGLQGVPGVVETVPTIRSVLIVIDPLAADRARIAETAERLARELPPDLAGTGRVLEVPVVYGGAAGPDLEEVARLHSLSPRELIELHTGQEYLVYMLGFAPGFPYLGILPPSIQTPRLALPRLRVPAGSVGIADALTGIYPLQTPGGWRLLGRTPLIIFDPREADPVLFRPGDRVRFVAIAEAEFLTVPLGSRRPLHPAMRPVLEVHEAGLYTTIQDSGRPGYRPLGLPAGGVMDVDALHLANLIAGNRPGAAAIECTAPGPVLRVLDDVTVVIAGADLSPTLDGASVEMWTPVAARVGQTLAFGAPRRGVWACLAVTGGIDVPSVLGSAATFVPGGLGGSDGRRVQAGDVFGRGEGARRSHPVAKVVPALPEDEVAVRVISGPQEAWFTGEGLATFWRSAYRVTVHSDRAGTRLEGPPIAHRDRADILSDGLLPGAVQVPGGGQPIVIMPDGPTTGGYPKVGVVATVDLRLIAQARPGARVRFVPTTVEAAVESLREWKATIGEMRDEGIKG